MRHAPCAGLLIDYIRSRLAQKRGGGFQITSLPTQVPEAPEADMEIEKLGEALEELETTDPRLARLVDLRFFCGFSFAEIAELLGISEQTPRSAIGTRRAFISSSSPQGPGPLAHPFSAASSALVMKESQGSFACWSIADSVRAFSQPARPIEIRAKAHDANERDHRGDHQWDRRPISTFMYVSS